MLFYTHLSRLYLFTSGFLFFKQLKFYNEKRNQFTGIIICNILNSSHYGRTAVRELEMVLHSLITFG